MENVEEELPKLINRLLQAPFNEQRLLISRHYTPECRLTHPLIIAENREEIIRVFQWWRFMNRHLTATVHEIVMDTSNKKVWIQFTQTIEHFQHIPFFSFDLSMSTLLYLDHQESDHRCWVITKQVDYHSFESILYNWPIIGLALEKGFRRMLSWIIINSASHAAAVNWLNAEQVLRKYVPFPQLWGRLKRAGVSLWWRKERKYFGRAVSPYVPQL